MDIFSPMENSTCTVEGVFRGVEHNEEELIAFLNCYGNIVAIDCNYGHLRSVSYKPPVRERKSNRGRKKKPKFQKNRKMKGDGTNFNSQISFTVLGTVVRPKPLTPDKHSLVAVAISETMEKFEKEYKIKVFRNGKFTVPGVLLEDMSDVMQPLEDLSSYFANLFDDDVYVDTLFSVMRNYKFHMLKYRINIRNLQRFCTQHMRALVNIQFNDVTQYMIDHIYRRCSSDYVDPDLDEMLAHLTRPGKNKTLLVNVHDLRTEILELPGYEVYSEVRSLILMSGHLPEIMVRKIIHNMLDPLLRRMQHSFESSEDNVLSHVNYDPEKYPGFLIKIKTPNPTRPDKKTTIKIFPSGKINIDGSNSREEAERIYNWLLKIFVENEYIYKPVIESSSSESSESDMD